MVAAMTPPGGRRIAGAARAAVLSAAAVCGASSPSRGAPTHHPVEEIYVLRSVRERHTPVADWCSPAKTGFAPLATDPERSFSFWSVTSVAGKVVDAKALRVAELRGCLGPSQERPRQHFYAEIKLGSLSFRGTGECVALALDFPEPGLVPVRCQLVLSGLPAPYVGGVLTTNTLTSKAAFGAESEPPGYIQASIATIRLWKTKKKKTEETRHE
jgi:hypothetical protein